MLFPYNTTYCSIHPRYKFNRSELSATGKKNINPQILVPQARSLVLKLNDQITSNLLSKTSVVIASWTVFSSLWLAKCCCSFTSSLICTFSLVSLSIWGLVDVFLDFCYVRPRWVFFSYLFLRRIRCCVNRRRGTSLWYRSLASPTEVTVFILRHFVWKHIAFHGDFYKSKNWASLTLSKSSCKLDCNAIERVWRTLTGIPVYELYYLFLLLLLLLFIFKVFVFFLTKQINIFNMNTRLT